MVCSADMACGRTLHGTPLGLLLGRPGTRFMGQALSNGLLRSMYFAHESIEVCEVGT